MKMWSTFLITTLITISALAQKNKLPEDAQKVVNKLPDNVLSVELVVAKAYGSADSAQAIKAQAYGVEAPYYRAQSILDINAYGSAKKSKSESSGLSSFEPIDSELYTAGVSKRLSTGTNIGFELNQERYEYKSAFFGLINEKSTGTVSVSQSLWKDAFGKATRKVVKAGEHAKEANKYDLKDSIEEWTLNLIGLYYQAWLSQAQTRAAEESLKRRQRLLNITNFKLKRGTAEKPDYLQVKSAFNISKVNLFKAEENLQGLWRDLVTSLKFPQNWMEVSAQLIPLRLDDPYVHALSLCSRPELIESSKQHSSSYLYWQEQSRATQLQLEAAESKLAPDVSLEGSFTARGIDQDSSSRFNDVFAGENSSWGVGVNFKMPLSFFAEKSDYMEALANAKQAKARFSAENSNHHVNWVNTCARLKSLAKEKKLLQEAYEVQARRIQQEESRFRLGRVPTITVMQAGDEATDAELKYLGVQVELNSVAWQVFRLNGDVETYLKRIGKKYENFKL